MLLKRGSNIECWRLKQTTKKKKKPKEKKRECEEKKKKKIDVGLV